MLTKEQIKQLRQDIVVGSIFSADYENSLGIDRNDAYYFSEGYLDYLRELTGSSELEVLDRADTLNNMWSYYQMFEKDPLPITK